MSVSAWLAEAAADRLRNDLLKSALDAWEAEDGLFDGGKSRARAVLNGGTRDRAAWGLFSMQAR